MTTLKDVPVPLGDVKNVVDEIYFEDGSARSRCRGWLVLPSRKYLRADILFPGCEFDCRFFIRARRGTFLNNNGFTPNNIKNPFLVLVSYSSMGEHPYK